MLKKTYYIENPSRLSLKLNQICIDQGQGADIVTRDLDDAGMIILDHAQINLSVPLLQSCIEKNVILTVCDNRHLPTGLWLPLEGHSQSGGRMRSQLESSKPLRKQLWQKTIQAKLLNQSKVLQHFHLPFQPLLKMSQKVRSGDSSNIEGTAAAYYWKKLFQDDCHFRRDRYGVEPNSLLNYIYALLRALTAKCLVGSGLTPLQGIHHKNIYNTLCLADDIMEPFRPFADMMVKSIIRDNPELLDEFELSKATKQYLLGIFQLDVMLENQKRPLQIAMQMVCANLSKCFESDTAKYLIYPEI